MSLATTVSEKAEKGDIELLRMVYGQDFPRKVVDVFESNNEFFKRLLDDTNLLNLVQEQMWRVFLRAFGMSATDNKADA